MNADQLFEELGLNTSPLWSGELEVASPIDGSCIARIEQDTLASTQAKINLAQSAFLSWRQVPAPQRGELVRQYGELLRRHKQTLGKLISLECGKIISEGEGEVQEMIDICDFAVGLSRQLYGLTIASERKDHALRETWHPIGPIGVISAFNFPMAVWAWNASIALVCGNSVVWKPSEKTPLCALACQALLDKVLGRFENAAPGLAQVVIGESDIGAALVADPRLPVISATGSCAMGQKVAPIIAGRFGRAILELGGNNAIIVSNKADIEMAVRAIIFGAVGTAGQRCTTTRRVFAHADVYTNLVDRLKSAYQQLKIGNPLESQTLVGPLIDSQPYDQMQSKLEELRALGCVVTGGERTLEETFPNAYYVNPALVEARGKLANAEDEVFAPLLYLFEYTDLNEAITRQNSVPQGLSSSIFTLDMREAETFLSAAGSDCGIANVNAGTSGAEIGGAFGGEKATGGGRESGSDAWKAYMRRSTATINYSSELPLAQGISFDI